MEVLDAAGQPSSYPSVVQVHMEVVEAASKLGSYPGPLLIVRINKGVLFF